MELGRSDTLHKLRQSIDGAIVMSRSFRFVTKTSKHCVWLVIFRKCPPYGARAGVPASRYVYFLSFGKGTFIRTKAKRSSGVPGNSKTGWGSSEWKMVCFSYPSRGFDVVISSVSSHLPELPSSFLVELFSTFSRDVASIEISWQPVTISIFSLANLDSFCRL